MQDPALGEADRDQAEHEGGGEDAADHGADRSGVEGEGAEAEQHQQHPGPGDHGRVDRAAPLLGPVDVFEVDPEGELVDRQAGADPEGEGADLGVGALAEGEEAERSGGHHRHDPEDEVVDVDAAVADHAARPPGHLRAPHQPRAHADEGEGEDEADEDEEEPLLVLLFELAPEVGEDRGGDHAGTGAECTGGAVPSLAAISSTVSRTAATAKTGERTMLDRASASQVPKKVSPSRRWTSDATALPMASPPSSIGTTTQKTNQKLPRTN